MQNKKRLHKHLLMIYIIYFAALIVGFAASFVPDFSRGWRNAQNTLEMEIPQGGIRSYYVSAPVIRSAGEPIGIDNLPENITPTISRLDLKVTVDEAYTLGNAFKVMGNNSFCYLLMVITGLSYLTILVLIALIINSLRKSIRDEQPLRHSNILRTRAIGILILVGELSEAFMKYLNNNEAVRLLEFRGQLIHHVVKHAFAELGAAVAGHAAAHGLIADAHRLDRHTVCPEDLLHLAQRDGGVAVRVRAAVEHQYLQFLHCSLLLYHCAAPSACPAQRALFSILSSISRKSRR